MKAWFNFDLIRGVIIGLLIYNFMLLLRGIGTFGFSQFSQISNDEKYMMITFCGIGVLVILAELFRLYALMIKPRVFIRPILVISVMIACLNLLLPVYYILVYKKVAMAEAMNMLKPALTGSNSLSNVLVVLFVVLLYSMVVRQQPQE